VSLLLNITLTKLVTLVLVFAKWLRRK